MSKIILDTNFLLTMVRYKIHAVQEIKERVNGEIFVLSGTIGELDGLSKGSKKIKNEVAIVREIIKKNNIRVIESKVENVDNELVEKSNEFVIATNDKKLREKIRQTGGKSVYIKKLAMVDMSEITD